MAAYEYFCLACDHRFEERRAMTASVITEPICPSCGDDRVRRRFSFVAGRPTVAGRPASADLGSAGTGGCGCGGACACGH
jgi:putative FmdB family regulatory protein